MNWIMISAVLIATLGGGAGVAYAADGSAPGSPLYGLDQMMENVHYATAFTAESRMQIALAHAEERLAEARQLAAGEGDESNIQTAMDGYGESVSSAAAALAEVASSGDEFRTQALADLLATSLSIHEQVLADIMNEVPEAAFPAVQRAIESSRTGTSTVQGLFEQGESAGPPDDASIGPPEVVPQGPPESAPGAPFDTLPGDQESGQETGRPEDLDARIAALSERTDEIQALIEEGDHEDAEVTLDEFENEVDSLAQDLAAVAKEDEARAEALAALLEEALARHAEVLTQLADQAPSEAQAYILSALEASAQGLEALWSAFGVGIPPGGPPTGVPSGGTYGPGG